MTRNIAATHSLPADPLWAEIPYTDGNSNTWPTATVEVIDDENCVNWMKRQELTDTGSIKWRINIGKALASHHGWEGDSNRYVLKDWPAGYAMFDHHKGPVEKPRHDLYLFGHKSKFRSPPEFVPHAIWLSTEPNLRGVCGCKYCGHGPRMQREITSGLVATGVIPSSHGGPSSRSLGPRRAQPKKRPVIHDIGLHASVQNVPKLSRAPHVVKYSMSVERAQHLHAMNSTSSSKMRRWHRERELVWMALPRPVTGTHENHSLRFWPGFVTECKINKKTIPDETLPSQARNDSMSPEGAKNSQSTVLPVQSPGWKVLERQFYRIRLLGLSAEFTLPEEHVLPYQAYTPPRELIDALQKLPFEMYDIDNLSNDFDPTSGDVTWNEAISPYVLAIQIAGALASFWHLTDDWDAKIALPAPAPEPVAATAPPAPKASSQTSLIDALNQASLQNGSGSGSGARANDSASAGPSRSSRRDQPDAELERTTRRALGEASTTVTHFQGMWWGPERIWTDELVRLKSYRGSFAPRGTDRIFAPAGPGPKLLARCEAEGRRPEDVGAAIRGIFLLVQRIFVAELAEDGKRRKQVRVSGMLYELVDEDWVEPPGSEGVGPEGTGVADSLSHPPPVKKLPPAPIGYRFRPIMRDEDEAVLSLALVCGRYYPGILRHPALVPQVTNLFESKGENSAEGNFIWALEGLSSGILNSVECVKYMTSRKNMIEEAECAARRMLKEFLAGQAAEGQVEKAGDAMDVDS